MNNSFDNLRTKINNTKKAIAKESKYLAQEEANLIFAEQVHNELMEICFKLNIRVEAFTIYLQEIYIYMSDLLHTTLDCLMVKYKEINMQIEQGNNYIKLNMPVL